MSHFRKHRKSPLSEINVVPYIDVMLVLLVIFMITTPLLSQGINVKLPQTQTKTLSTPQEPIIVSIDSQGNYYLNVSDTPNQPLSMQTIFNQVAARLQIAKQNGQKQPVFVKGDRDVYYGKVVQMMSALQKTGIDHVGLLTQSNKTP